MNSGKLLKYAGIAAAVLIVFALIGKKAGWLGKADAIKVAVEMVQKRNLVEMITANGKIQPETEVKISSEVSGEIIELNVKDGDEVKAGQLMVKIKPDTYISIRERSAAAVNASRANLANAKARLAQVSAQFAQSELSYQRNKKLWEQKTISESEWESSEASYKMAKADVDAAAQNVASAEYGVKSSEASLKEANENLVKTSIYAPMSGTISALGVEKGERVLGTSMMTGTELLRIADLSRMEVKVDVNENDIVRVSLGDTVIIEVDAYLGEKFKGVVTEIANSAKSSALGSADQVTNFEVKIFVLETSYKHLFKNGVKTPFRPGMSATVDIQTETKNNIPTIPIQAITTRTDSLLTSELGKDSAQVKWKHGKKDDLIEIAFIVKDNKAYARPVKTGIQDNTNIEVISGLGPDEKIVAAPFSAISKKLKHGSQVEVVEKKDLFKEEK